jgi:uncharacterized protein
MTTKPATHMSYFGWSHATTVVGLVLAYLWAGIPGVMIAGLLMLMEISLSFDNAVVNASVLKNMEEKWQRYFLTWGILIAVFGMRLLFPLLIVSLSTGLGFMDVTTMAFEDPDTYSANVLAAHVHIAAFGGMFLLMVFLHFIMDEGKELHWLGMMEQRLAKLGKLESVEVIFALGILLTLAHFLPTEHQRDALSSGTIGVVLYVLINSLTALCGHEEGGNDVTKAVGYSGFMGFMYLQLLDASFSLDGVVGAFAMSKDVVIIMIGLGIGAMFVRSLTVYLVRKGTLSEYVYLEHGAHYGIAALAAIMLSSMFLHIPEIITGLIGLTFIGLSLVSSIKYNRVNAHVA